MSHEPDASGIGILLVDDDPEMLDMMDRLCKSIGLKCDLANDGEEALDKIRKGNYLIVVSDIKMPKMNGLDLLKKIKKLSPPTRVIMVTGYVTQQNILTAMNRGADCCVVKPFENKDGFLSAVTRALEMIQEWRAILMRLKRMGKAS